ncbi:putative reverse transcriptase domain-containing protein [Tanacetum coccineum]
MIGELKFFLGLQVHQSPCDIFISQSQYSIELLKKHGLDECVSMSTPMATERLDADLQGTPTDQTTCRIPITLHFIQSITKSELEMRSLADASLHMPLDEIKVDKTLRFVEEPVEILNPEVKSLKRSKIALVKVRWNSKCGPEFTWEREDYMKSKYPQLFAEQVDASAG